MKVPMFVIRVGYPKSVDDYVAELREKYPAALDELICKVIPRKGPAIPRHAKEAIEREVAYAMAMANCFGGNERSLHWEVLPELADKEFRVESVRTVKTGWYVPASGGKSMFDDDYEPAYLDDQKTHRLAAILVQPFELVSKLSRRGENRKEIPVYHLEKVR